MYILRIIIREHGELPVEANMNQVYRSENVITTVYKI